MKKHDVFSKIKSEILVEIWAEIFFKKKLFFLAMFKNEITTFKKKNLKIFRFFFKKKFQKIDHKNRLGPVFSKIFFFIQTSFLQRFSRSLFENWNLAGKLWKLTVNITFMSSGTPKCSIFEKTSCFFKKKKFNFFFSLFIP